MAERFTQYCEWMAEWDELTLPQALVLSRIKQWGNAGCFESYNTLSKRLKLSRRTVIETVVFLLEKELITRNYRDKRKQKRTLVFNFDRTNLPIFDNKVVREMHQLPKKVVREPHQVVREVHPNISSKRQNKEETEEMIFASSEMTRHEAELLSDTEFNKRKNEQIKKLLS